MQEQVDLLINLCGCKPICRQRTLSRLDQQLRNGVAVIVEQVGERRNRAQADGNLLCHAAKLRHAAAEDMDHERLWEAGEALAEPLDGRRIHRQLHTG